MRHTDAYQVKFRLKLNPDELQELISRIPPKVFEDTCKQIEARILRNFDREIIRQSNREWFIRRGLIP